MLFECPSPDKAIGGGVRPNFFIRVLGLGVNKLGVKI